MEKKAVVMEKSVKIILFVVLAVVIINFLMTIFGNSDIKDIRKDLQKADRTADSALKELAFSKSRLDAIKSDMLTFKNSIDSIKSTVNVIDNAKNINEARDIQKTKEIKTIIKTLREEVVDTFNLPEIDVISTNK